MSPIGGHSTDSTRGFPPGQCSDDRHCWAHFGDDRKYYCSPDVFCEREKSFVSQIVIATISLAIENISVLQIHSGVGHE